MEKLDKEKKAKIMDILEKAGDPENYETSWDEKGGPKSKFKPDIKRGKKSKGSGSRFELKVRRDLESNGRIVDKWSNNVDLGKNELTIAKKVFNPFKKFAVPGAGFPDFISTKHMTERLYSVIGVEVKMNGMLSKLEKEKCAWYLQKKIFSEIWIAKQGTERGEIVYDDFFEKYGNKYDKA